MKRILLLFFSIPFFMLSCYKPIDYDEFELNPKDVGLEWTKIGWDSNIPTYSKALVLADNSIVASDGKNRISFIDENDNITNHFVEHTDIYVDKNGVLFIIKENDSNLYFYVNNRWVTVRIKHYATNYEIVPVSVAVAPDGLLWINNSKFILKQNSEYDFSTNASTMLVEGVGLGIDTYKSYVSSVFSTESGLFAMADVGYSEYYIYYRWNGGKFVYLFGTEDNSSFSDYGYDIVGNKNGKQYILDWGMTGATVYTYDDETKKYLDFMKGSNFYVDSRGYLWGCGEESIQCFEEDQFVDYSPHIDMKQTSKVSVVDNYNGSIYFLREDAIYKYSYN